MTADRRRLILFTVLAALVLGTLALLMMFTWLLAKPIGRLIAGTERIAAYQLDFRFDQTRRDEIGVLEASFDTMTARIQGHQYDAGECPEVVVATSLSEDGGFLAIEVRDNGCGMNEEIRRNVFTPFFSTRKTLGTGLGLALAARIINVHKGEITVESESDRGSAFRIRLPIDGPKDTRETCDGQTSARN